MTNDQRFLNHINEQVKMRKWHKDEKTVDERFESIIADLQEIHQENQIILKLLNHIISTQDKKII